MSDLRTGTKIRTSTGKLIDVFNPKSSDIHIEDIANGLSQMPRFAGQLPEFFSVAQHSIRGTYKPYLTTIEEKFTFLLHDATEAYMCDLPKPIKDKLPGYKVAEDKLMAVIAEVFEIPFPFPPIIKKCDEYLLQEEYDNLFIGPNESNIVSYTPQQAKKLFLTRFKKLQRARNAERRFYQSAS